MEHNNSLQFNDLPELTEIIIDEIKSNIGSEISTKKLKEIIYFVATHNEMITYEEYVNLKQIIFDECQEEDYELLLIHLGHEIEFDGIVYKINQQNKTASLFQIKIKKDKIIIPRSITYESNEYIITSIVYDTFPSYKKVKSIQFDEKSELHTIYDNSLYNSPIEKIFFPKNLTDLRDLWAFSCFYLKDIEISPLNKKFIYKDNKCLLGKSDINSDNYDILFFVRRDISEFEIPSTVKIISSNAFSKTKIKSISIPPQITTIKSYAFYYCDNLENIEISEDSELKEIGECAFCSTKINSIFIPKNLTELDGGSLHYLVNLKKITISPLNNKFSCKDDALILTKSNMNNDFDTIVFARSNLKEVKIPSNIKFIGPKAFQYCNKLKRIEIPINSELEIIGNNSFLCSAITQIYIPQHVKIIDDYAFCRCNNLTHLEFAKNSELQIIKKYAFYDTKVSNIEIPNSVIKIGKYAFDLTRVNNIDIQENSQLQSIGKYGLHLSATKEIFIPKNLKTIKKGCFSFSKSLTKINISPLNDRFKYKDDKYLLTKSNINNDNYDVLLFARRDIQEAEISSNIKIIASHSFDHCEKLTKINIPKNSELQIIENNAFDKTNISDIYIPKNVIKIEKDAFYECQNINIVEIPYDSKLKLINEHAFNSTNITKIFIPQYVSHIYDRAFFNCANLKIVKIHENSELKSIGSDSFYGTKIYKISIPEKVSLICDRAFLHCNNLQYVKFHQNSQLKSIGEYAFSNTKIKGICIPEKVSLIGKIGFGNCTSLQIVEINQNSQLSSIDISIFDNCPHCRLMIPSTKRNIIKKY